MLDAEIYFNKNLEIFKPSKHKVSDFEEFILADKLAWRHESCHTTLFSILKLQSSYSENNSVLVIGNGEIPEQKQT